MAAALSVDLRERVVAAYEAGEGTMKALGMRFSVGQATVKRWVRRKRQRGALEPGPYRLKEPKIREEHLAVVQAIVDEAPDETREALTRTFNARVGMSVSTSAMQRAFERLGITRKKRRSMRPNETAMP